MKTDSTKSCSDRSPRLYELKIKLPGLPKMMNKVHSRWSRMSERKKWKSAVYCSIRQEDRPPEPLAKAHITCIRRSSKVPDYDGIVSGFKHIIDGLIEAGIITDDSMEVIGVPDFRWEKVSQRQGEIEVHVHAIL